MTGATPQLGGDPSESALLAAALDLGHDVVAAQSRREARRRKVYAFDPRVKRMTTLDEEPDGDLVYHSKGAPLELLSRCASIRAAGGVRPLDDELRAEVAQTFDRYARRGLRVLGFAQRTGDRP